MKLVYTQNSFSLKAAFPTVFVQAGTVRHRAGQARQATDTSKQKHGSPEMETRNLDHLRLEEGVRGGTKKESDAAASKSVLCAFSHLHNRISALRDTCRAIVLPDAAVADVSFVILFLATSRYWPSSVI